MITLLHSIVIIIPVSLFADVQMFRARKHNASAYIVFCLEIKDASDCKQLQQMTRGAKCFLDIRWLPLRSILHSRPNLPNTITSISPEDPRLYLPPFMVAKQPWVEGATHELKWFWGITIVTSEFCTTPIQESRQKNGPHLGKKKAPKKQDMMEGNRRDDTNYGTKAELLLDSS